MSEHRQQSCPSLSYNEIHCIHDKNLSSHLLLYTTYNHLDILSRSKFEELNSDLFNKCFETVEKCLMDAEVKKNDVDDVVMIGGSSRIPKVQEMLQQLLNGKGICRSINPDEAVAYGAAVQAAILSGQVSEKIRNLVLVDVTPLSLGLESVGEIMKVVIPKNTIIPVQKKTDRFTVTDNQTSCLFKIFEGERAKSTDNKLLGTFRLEGIHVAKRGEAIAEVCFNLESNGVLKVSARDKTTGSTAGITITSGCLSKEEIEKMLEDANRFKADDEMHREKGKARRAFEKYACETRVSIENMNSGDKKKKATDAIQEAFEWLDSQIELAEVHQYEEKMEKLKRIFN